MYNFIVLGIVPGTDLQITFDTWLKLMEIAVIAYGVLRLKIIHTALSTKAWERVPMHANQLHRRG